MLCPWAMRPRISREISGSKVRVKMWSTLRRGLDFATPSDDAFDQLVLVGEARVVVSEGVWRCGQAEA